MLRGRLPDKNAEYPPPKLGINLRRQASELVPGEAFLLQNFYYDGGTRNRTGSQRLTPSSLGAFGGRGGHRFYFSASGKARLISYGTNISSISDAGVETILDSTLTNDQDGYFETWSVTDSAYFMNKADVLRKIDSTLTASTVTGTNIPTGGPIKVFLDRLFAIQGNGVVNTNPRSDSIWSPTTSSWSFYRPSGSGGRPTALATHAYSNWSGAPLQTLLIFQTGSVTALSGTNFDDDVTAAVPSANWDAQLVTLDPRTGTSSPYSIATVPGVGTFWVTSDYNVAWLPTSGNQQVQLIGDKLYSFRTDVQGLNNINTAALGQVVMVYHDRKLKLYLPISADYTTIQYWLDIKPLQEQQAGVLSGQVQSMPVSWSGPHIGQSLRRVWAETQSGDNNILYGLEGNSNKGLYVYELNPSAGPYTDAVGSADVDVDEVYHTFYNTFGAPSINKYMPDIRFDVSGRIADAQVSIADLHQPLTGPAPIVHIDGTPFTQNLYGTGLKYGTGVKYGASSGPNIGHVDFNAEQTTAAPIGDALQIRIAHPTAGSFIVNRILPQVKVRREEPVNG